MPVMVFILLTIVFLILRVLPGNPVEVILGPKATPEIKEALMKQWGLDKPWYIQYIDFISRMLRGDFGLSYYWKLPINTLIWPRFFATVELAILSMIVAIILGLTLGSLGALKRNTILDHVSRFFGVAAYAIPVFWLGLILQLVFGVYLHLFPTSGRISTIIEYRIKTITGLYLIDTLLQGDIEAFLDVLSHMALPSLALGFIISGVINRMTRQNLSEVLQQDFIVAAKARGLPEKLIFFRYALKNALIPIITIAGMQFALLMAGAVLTESTFSYPGLGTFLMESIYYRDYNAIQAAVVVYAIVVVIVNTIVDIIYAYIDPRIRY